MQRRLTDRTLQALKKKAKRYEVSDLEAPGLGVRVSTKGTKTFVLIARYPGVVTQCDEPWASTI